MDRHWRMAMQRAKGGVASADGGAVGGELGSAECLAAAGMHSRPGGDGA